MANTILITGASSGIGRALALYYAAPGRRLVLVGRNEGRLAEVADACRAKGADVAQTKLDIRNRDGLLRFAGEQDKIRPIELVIVNAAVTTGTPEGGVMEPPEESYLLADVNVLGALNTVHAVLPLMMERGNGQIGLVSSIAGLIPLPDSPTYSATKAALVAYGKAMRARVRTAGVRINVICPGFVTTPMSERVSGWKPGEIAPERAAELIANGLARNRAVIAFPWTLAALARIGALLPDPLLRIFLRAFSFTTKPPPPA